jgi:hypothetical protein
MRAVTAEAAVMAVTLQTVVQETANAPAVHRQQSAASVPAIRHLQAQL